MYKRIIKPASDRILAAIALVLLSPLLVVIAGLIFARMGRPVLFRHRRPGLSGEPFDVLKFRTMKNEHDEDGEPRPDEERLTTLGRFLRSISLDELPELFNVIRGEMSLVGPRPLLMEYLEHYSSEEMRRHEVKPGITGWAQINGRNALSWEEKFRHDVWYVDHLSFRLDLKILMLTIWKTLKREGISQPGHATAERFEGRRLKIVDD